MRWIALIFFYAVLWTAHAEPEPKKYKSVIKDADKNKTTNSSLTNDERKFLREVEAKFGVKTDVPEEIIKNSTEEKSIPLNKDLPFPAVIAIEIVNDTDKNTKGKRTIDANLGYGYRTNNGYSYTYFGKPEGNAKFTVYPYSQEDIPPAGHNTHSLGYSYQRPRTSGKGSLVTDVEIKPSQAYELVPTNHEQDGYQYSSSPSTGWAPSTASSYSSVVHHNNYHSPSPAVSTLYTTYNGHQFTGLSKQFPTVSPNYLVDSSQLLKTPQYQNAGITQDYLSSHGSTSEQRVVPVLVLRIPSSYVKSPAAELYADFSPNYLNSLNLQDLVNEYFKKIGFSTAPQVMAYQNSPVAVTETPGVTTYEQQYTADAYSQSQPSYTQSQYSGIEYSPVQQAVTKFPAEYTSHPSYHTSSQPLYRQPVQPQNYEYSYQYVPQQAGQAESYYSPQHLASSQAEAGNAQDSYSQYAEAQQASHPEPGNPTAEYGAPNTQAHQSYYKTSQSAAPVYETSQTPSSEYGPAQKEEYSSTKAVAYDSTVKPIVEQTQLEYGPAKDTPHYFTQQEPTHSNTAAVYPGKTEQADFMNYYYQKLLNDARNSQLLLHENYPSKDHTIATVLPQSSKVQNVKTYQTVNYVTPVPNLAKYQSHFRVMGPQMFLKNPNSERVTYISPQAHSSHYTQDIHSGMSYTPDSMYSVSYKSPATFPRHYFTHSKRMTKPGKSESTSTAKKHTDSKSHH